MIERPEDDGSPLDPEVHRELLRGSRRYARLAGIREAWLWQPLSAHATPHEVRWVSQYPRHRDRGVRGILYVGSPACVGDRMQAMCGALVRNFVDARLRPIRAAWEEDGEAGRPSECSVLLIPDLCVGPQEVPDWLRSAAASLLQQRAVDGLQTLTYACGVDALRSAYGPVVAELLGDQRAYKVVRL